MDVRLVSSYVACEALAWCSFRWTKRVTLCCLFVLAWCFLHCLLFCSGQTGPRLVGEARRSRRGPVEARAETAVSLFGIREGLRAELWLCLGAGPLLLALLLRFLPRTATFRLLTFNATNYATAPTHPPSLPLRTLAPLVHGDSVTQFPPSSLTRLVFNLKLVLPSFQTLAGDLTGHTYYIGPFLHYCQHLSSVPQSCTVPSISLPPPHLPSSSSLPASDLYSPRPTSFNTSVHRDQRTA